MGLCGSLKIFLRPYAFYGFLMGRYRLLFVFTISKGSLCVLIGSCSSVWILMGPYGSL